jgi:hypothetical protein
MCRNHSHLIATFIGEDTSGEFPVLMFLLANTAIAIENPVKGGPTLICPTTGKLLIPSWALAGFSPLLQPGTEVPAMSLFFLPGEDTTTMQLALEDWRTSFDPSGTM